MTLKIYDQHQAAFSNVSAFVITKDGERVATIAFKFPRDGAGRLYAYVHYFGVDSPMVRGFANGYGYDKKSAAVEDAIRKSTHFPHPNAFRLALCDIGGSDWQRRLQDAGFNVMQAV